MAGMDAYQLGFEDGYVDGENSNPYEQWTAEFDAYEAGFDDGMDTWAEEAGEALMHGTWM